MVAHTIHSDTMVGPLNLVVATYKDRLGWYIIDHHDILVDESFGYHNAPTEAVKEEGTAAALLLLKTRYQKEFKPHEYILSRL